MRDQREALAAWEKQRMTGNPKGRIAKPPYADMHETKEFMPAGGRAGAGCRGWRVYHTHDSRKSAEGFGDLVHGAHGEGLPRAAERQTAAAVSWNSRARRAS